jgi:4-amino-4-deoxychorismate lyase
MLVNGIPGDTISIRDRGMLYGDGVFRTICAVDGKAMHWQLHYHKLKHDCTSLGIACPDIALLFAEMDRILVQHPNVVMKLIVTRGSGSRGYAPAAQNNPTHIWDISPLPDYPDDWATLGIKARVCQLHLGQQPRLAGIKHLNRLENVLAASESNDSDVAEGLLMDAGGNVIEGIRSNLFLVSHGELVTPDLSRCGVAGVQRDRVIALAAQYNIPVRVRDVGLDDVMNADEVFVVNSVIGLWPVRELDQRRWPAFPVAARIRHYLTEQDSQ